jgi:hypothetical protein
MNNFNLTILKELKNKKIMILMIIIGKLISKIKFYQRKLSRSNDKITIIYLSDNFYNIYIYLFLILLSYKIKSYLRLYYQFSISIKK